MEELISMVVANGLWATLFCILLAYELKDSRRRESRYTETIGMLGDRLGAVSAIKTDTETIKADVSEIKADAVEIKTELKSKKTKKGGAVCAGTV